MYKNLFAEVLLAEPQRTENYKLPELFEFTTEKLLPGLIDDKNVVTYATVFEKPYIDNLKYIKETGLPNPKSEQFNFSNLHKLYGLEITPRTDRNEYGDFDWVADKSNEMVIVDGTVLASNNISHNTSPSVTILDAIVSNTSKQREYVKYIKQTNNFTNTTYSLSPFVNIMVFPASSKMSYEKKPMTVHYLNERKENTLSSNTTMFDIQHKTSVKLKEKVRTTAGQMNYSIYILREGSKLEIDRTTKDKGGWSLFDSVFICHPNSELIIKSTNTGSQYTQ